MDIFKNKKVVLLLELTSFCLLALIIGSQNLSPFYGDLNLIDEGQFGAWINQMLHGKLMFKDIYITYGPLYVYPLFLLSKFLTPTAFLLRFYLSIGVILGIIILNFLMLDLKIKTIPRYIFNFLIIFLPILTLRQSLSFVAIYLLFISYSKQSYLFSFLGGLAVTTTFLVSPELGIITGILYLIYLILELYFENNKLISFKIFGYSLIGIFISFFIFFIWSYHESWFFSFIYTTKQIFVDFSGANAPNGKNLPNLINLFPQPTNFLNLLRFTLSKNLFIYLSLAINLYIFLILVVKLMLGKFLTDDKKLFIICLFSFSFLYLFISRPDIGHLFFGLSPLLLILIYYLNKSLIKIKDKSQKHKLLYGIIAFSILLIFTRLLYMNNPQIRKALYLPTVVFENHSNNARHVGPISISEEQNKYLVDLQTYFNKNSTQEDEIFIFSNLPMLYLILDRQNATSFSLPYLANVKSSRGKLLSELMINKPKFIIFDPTVYEVDEIGNVIRLPEVKKYIDENYKLETKINTAYIYKRASD